jgi:hypothetical protein
MEEEIFWVEMGSEAQFGSKNFCKKTVDSPSHRIFRRMYETLNIDKK